VALGACRGWLLDTVATRRSWGNPRFVVPVLPCLLYTIQRLRTILSSVEASALSFKNFSPAPSTITAEHQTLRKDPEMENAFALSTSDVLSNLGANKVDGLTDEQVLELRSRYGKNGE
jgi:hypothetical protein